MQPLGAHAAGDNAATIRTRPPVRWSDRQPAVHRFAPVSCPPPRHVPVPAPRSIRRRPGLSPSYTPSTIKCCLPALTPHCRRPRSARSAPTPAAVVDGRTPRRGIRLRPAHGPAGTPRYAEPTPPGSTRSAPQAPRSAGGWVRSLFHRRGPGARSRARDSSHWFRSVSRHPLGGGHLTPQTWEVVRDQPPAGVWAARTSSGLAASVRRLRVLALGAGDGGGGGSTSVGPYSRGPVTGAAEADRVARAGSLVPLVR